MTLFTLLHVFCVNLASGTFFGTQNGKTNVHSLNSSSVCVLRAERGMFLNEVVLHDPHTYLARKVEPIRCMCVSVVIGHGFEGPDVMLNDVPVDHRVVGPVRLQL